ncbi:MAG: hypothetical protein JXA64_10100 [Candidatus Fermentibacteraceae bacterium]|nr:hypothetical protein [Candidatus Fermentibacteraceae bacterium]MBN2609452.1 hypothetical protein [Candidatus Fermentibacteraceae bacterium]
MLKNKFSGRLVPPALGILAATAVAGQGQGNEPVEGTPDSTSGENAADGSFLTRTSVLWSNPQWQELRRVWRKMDAYSVSEEGDRPSSEESGKLRVELERAFSDLGAVAEDLGLQELEIRLLRSLAFHRLDYLAYGTSMPMTRMMPPPVSDQTDGLVPVIESRIDAVAELRREGVLTGGEMRAAFTDLRTSMDLYFILESINNQVGYSSVLWMERWPMDADSISVHLDSLRTSMLENINASDEFVEEVRSQLIEEFDSLEDALEETRSRLPVLHDMLMSLELL